MKKLIFQVRVYQKRFQPHYRSFYAKYRSSALGTDTLILVRTYIHTCSYHIMKTVVKLKKH